MTTLFGLLFRPNRIQIEYSVQPYLWCQVQTTHLAHRGWGRVHTETSESTSTSVGFVCSR